MARIVNTTLAKAGLAEACVVGDVARGLEVVPELTMMARAPFDLAAAAGALRLAFACQSVAREEETAIRLEFAGGGPATLRVVPGELFLESALRASSSPRHVRWLEARAKGAGGLGAACARAKDEADLYASLGVPFAPAELRDGPTPSIPSLVSGVRGIFHVHTTWSDGTASIADMARAAVEAGFSYVGITEHSRSAIYAGGLGPDRLKDQALAIDDVRAAAPTVHVLHGIEVDVLADGSLDLDDATLAELDFVIASVHTTLDMEPDAMTERLVRAVSHPLVTILGHPTGRLLLGRKEYPFDLEEVARAAAANDTFLEINANPQRLDLSAALARRAAAVGARFVIDPDAHTPAGVRDTALGVTVARRAGLSPEQVLNAKPVGEVLAYLAERRWRSWPRSGTRLRVAKRHTEE
jgi:DNA polymerase (family 10)